MAPQNPSEIDLLSDDQAIDCALRIMNLIAANVPKENIKAAIYRSSNGDDLQCTLGLLEDIYLP